MVWRSGPGACRGSRNSQHWAFRSASERKMNESDGQKLEEGEGGKERKGKTNLPKTTSSAGSLSRSPTMLVATQMYMPASLFLVLDIISFPPRI